LGSNFFGGCSEKYLGNCAGEILGANFSADLLENVWRIVRETYWGAIFPGDVLENVWEINVRENVRDNVRIPMQDCNYSVRVADMI